MPVPESLLVSHYKACMSALLYVLETACLAAAVLCAVPGGVFAAGLFSSTVSSVTADNCLSLQLCAAQRLLPVGGVEITPFDFG